MTAERWPHEQLDEAVLRFREDLENQRAWSVLVHVDEAAELLRIYSVPPRLAASREQTALGLTLWTLNYELGRGAFELDPSAGEVRFRTTARPDTDALGGAVRDHLSTMAQRFDVLSRPATAAQSAEPLG